MTWRGRLILVVAATVLGAGTWAAHPYWRSMVHSKESRRGWGARRQVAEDTPQAVWNRAAIGAAVGFVCALLSYSVRDRPSRPGDPNAPAARPKARKPSRVGAVARRRGRRRHSPSDRT